LFRERTQGTGKAEAQEMTFDEELEKEIAEIIGGLKCPKDFKCYRSGFENLCKAEDLGMDSFLVCLEETPSDCPFAFDFGSACFCQCPLRVYIAKKLKK
jgi:hypothetical protein